jgi:hypothetical protein
MKVFISWSGERSKIIAEAVNWLLPRIINTIDPWVSSEGIDPGSRWSPEIASQLERTDFGIICLTNDNLDSPWIHFEAGALSKFIDKAFVIPLLFENKIKDVTGPLSQFQAKTMTKANIKSIIYKIYDVSRTNKEISFNVAIIDEALDKYWGEFENRISSIPKIVNSEINERKDEDVLGEILEIVRTLRNVYLHNQTKLEHGYPENELLSYFEVVDRMTAFYIQFHGEESGKATPVEYLKDKFGIPPDGALIQNVLLSKPFMEDKIDEYFRYLIPG